MTHLPIPPMIKADVHMTSPRNSGWSRSLIYWLWHTSQKQKAPFQQGGTTVDHQNPAPNHSQNVTKVQEVKTSDSSGDVTWQFQCKFPIHLWLIYLTSFLDKSSTLRCFSIVKIGRWHHLKAFLFAFSWGCFHFSKISCNAVVKLCCLNWSGRIATGWLKQVVAYYNGCLTQVWLHKEEHFGFTS